MTHVERLRSIATALRAAADAARNAIGRDLPSTDKTELAVDRLEGIANGLGAPALQEAHKSFAEALGGLNIAFDLFEEIKADIEDQVSEIDKLAEELEGPKPKPVPFYIAPNIPDSAVEAMNREIQHNNQNDWLERALGEAQS